MPQAGARGLDVTPMGDQAGACHGSFPAGSLPGEGNMLCDFLMSLGLPGESGALSWEMA